MPFTLPDLPYDYDALEPTIDARTMEIHHGKHHQAYVDNANKALEGTELGGRDPSRRCSTKLDALPADNRAAVRNNAGGHANHSLFWTIMGPDGGGEPSGALAARSASLRRARRRLKERSTTRGVKRFGSGWTWLVVDGGRLAVMSTAEPGRADLRRRRRRSSASTSGSTPTTSTTRTAAPTTWPPGGTSSTGARWRGGSSGRKLTRPRRSSPAAPASSAPRSRSDCAARAGRCWRPGSRDGDLARADGRTSARRACGRRARRARRRRQRRVGRLRAEARSRRSPRRTSTPRSARPSRAASSSRRRRRRTCASRAGSS